MREIEIKAKLVDKKRIMKELKKLGCVFESPITQDDTVYVKNVEPLENFRSNNDIFLRLRIKNNNKILFTLKRRMVNDLDAIEHEVEVSSKEKMEKALLEMGFGEAVRINKTRIITHYNGCEICIDNVENLGSFIEMEKLTDDNESPEKIQEELFNFFKSIGIPETDRVKTGYDILMIEKKLGVNLN